MKRSFGLTTVVVLLFILAACGDATATTQTGAGTTMTSGTAMAGMTTTPGAMTDSDPMTDSLKGATGQSFEITFMQEMIAHHQSAIDMAKLIPTNTKRPELITLGQNIITAQTKEIGDMTGWLATWYNAKPVDPMTVPGMMDMMGQMDTLKNAKDAAFDKQFLSMMIQHHTQATNMAALVPQKATHAELKTTAQNIIASQTAEISQMKGWQAAWFKS